MPYLLFLKKQQNLKLSSAANYKCALLVNENQISLNANTKVVDQFVHPCSAFLLFALLKYLNLLHVKFQYSSWSLKLNRLVLALPGCKL